MGPTPVYGARAEKPLQNADFAMKQTNICRLSGDIITWGTKDFCPDISDYIDVFVKAERADSHILLDFVITEKSLLQLLRNVRL